MFFFSNISISDNGKSLFLQVADGNRNEIQNQEVNKRSFIGMEHVYFLFITN